MRNVNKFFICAMAAVSLGATATYVQAQQGPMGQGMHPSQMREAVMPAQMMGQNSNLKLMRELMTPAERLAMMDKMTDAQTFEERQAIMNAMRAEMEKRTREKGISLPTQHASQVKPGVHCG